MDLLFKVVLGLHIAGGFTALAAGLAAMVTDKGGKAHRLFGRIYFYGMTAACTASFYLAVAHPNPFLFMIGVFSYQLVAVGYRTLWLKQLYKGTIRPVWVDWLIGLVPGAFSMGMLGWGLLKVTAGDGFGVTGLVFGGIGLSIAVRWLRSFYVPPKEKSKWLFTHLQSMGGGYIATATAFLVVNVHVLPPIVVWLAPTAIGATIISFVTAKYKKKLAGKQPIPFVTEPAGA